MNGWQLAFGSGISATAVLIFLAAVAGEIAIMSDFLDRFEICQKKLFQEQAEAASDEEEVAA